MLLAGGLYAPDRPTRPYGLKQGLLQVLPSLLVPTKNQLTSSNLFIFYPDSSSTVVSFMFLVVLLFIENPDRIQHAQHSHARIGEYSQPHIRVSGQTQNHNRDLDNQSENHVLNRNTVGAAGDGDGGGYRLHTGGHEYRVSCLDSRVWTALSTSRTGRR